LVVDTPDGGPHLLAVIVVAVTGHQIVVDVVARAIGPEMSSWARHPPLPSFDLDAKVVLL
jgi:hypothetical protein